MYAGIFSGRACLTLIISNAQQAALLNEERTFENYYSIPHQRWFDNKIMTFLHKQAAVADWFGRPLWEIGVSPHFSQIFGVRRALSPSGGVLRARCPQRIF
jgi:hypothetical protein